MSERCDTIIGKVREIPKGEPWIRHSRALLSSDAWRSMGIHCRKLIEFLEIEHMNHAGLENGNLFATYKQLEKFGINRRYINSAICEAEQKGLIIVERGARKKVNESFPNKFTLTYLRSVEKINNCPYYYTPSNEWKRFKLTPKESNSAVTNVHLPSVQM